MSTLVRLLTALLLFSGLVTAQTASPAQPTPAPKKPKKVYSEEDLRNLGDGGISVVGEPERPPAKEKKRSEDDEEEDLADELAGNEPPPQSDCKTYSWSAILASVVRMQGVPLDRKYWNERLFGHPDCSNNIPTLPRLVANIEGEHTLEDGNRVRLRAKFVPALAQAADLLAAGRDNRAYIVIWSGQPYMMDGGNYVDWDNGTTYVIKDLRLVDPYTRRVATFVKDKNDLAQIEGSIDVQVMPRK